MTTNIKSWRERAGLSPDYQLTCPSAVEKAMEAEIAERKKQNEDLMQALRQAKVVADIQSARIKRLEERQNCHRPDFLLNGARFKLNFSTRGNVDVFHNYANELQGRWVALTPAEDDCHLVRSSASASGQESQP